MEHGSWLVQRLQKPYQLPKGHQFEGLMNAFSFGGGLKNGGLSDDAMGLIRDIWRFDYMGAAEFEFGAVPEALNSLAKAKLVAFEFPIPLAQVAANWRDKGKEKPEGDAAVYVLCPEGWEAEVERRIRGWAAPNDEKFRTKERVGIAEALRPFNEWDSEVCGWLELDNGFLFFTDREMWEKACSLFGVVTSEVAAA
jgi:hypothetical protein